MWKNYWQIYLVIILVGLLGAAAWLYKGLGQPSNPALPALALLADLPLPPNAHDVAIQVDIAMARRSFVTSVAFEEIWELYEQYFEAKGWESCWAACFISFGCGTQGQSRGWRASDQDDSQRLDVVVRRMDAQRLRVSLDTNLPGERGMIGAADC
jgi:hypothetical protein